VARRRAAAGSLAAGADRAGSAGTREIAGASHAITVSQPEAVTATIVDAAKAYVAGLAASAAA
jgi:hypothetical protein